jgi:hypothetical protein
VGIGEGELGEGELWQGVDVQKRGLVSSSEFSVIELSLCRSQMHTRRLQFSHGGGGSAGQSGEAIELLFNAMGRELVATE